MKTLLVIQSSIFGDDGKSAQITRRYAKQWQQTTGGEVIYRDVSEPEIPHLPAAAWHAFAVSAEERSPEQKALLTLSDELIAELRAADEVVVGVPMYNFTVSSALKAWIDHVGRVNETFRYTSNGPEGLLADRPVRIIASRGGAYADTPMDTQTPYLKIFFNFIGIEDIEFFYAEGMAGAAEKVEATLDRVSSELQRLLPQ